MPAAQPRNTDQTMNAVTRVPARQTGNSA
jgi:hypothetical protein